VQYATRGPYEHHHVLIPEETGFRQDVKARLHDSEQSFDVFSRGLLQPSKEALLGGRGMLEGGHEDCPRWINPVGKRVAMRVLVAIYGELCPEVRSRQQIL